jgi:hypothetical protein
VLGLVDMIPPVADSVKVCVLPGYLLLRGDVNISPSDLPRFPFSNPQLLRWALIPPDRASAEGLRRQGQKAAEDWMDGQGGARRELT